MPTVKQLQYFCDIAETGNMSLVATRSFVSQTALSSALSRLEKELGVMLFDRAGKKLVLNDYGRTYLEYAKAACDILENGHQSLTAMKQEKAGG